jgi:two-component system LytT family response regulator
MNILIIEDEQAAARRLKKILGEIDQKIDIVGHTDGIESSIDWLKNNSEPDLIFLDIHLSDGRCFEIFNHIIIDKPIVFTTAYDEYALQAFKHNTIDYLLKPVKKAELVQALEKLKKRQSFDYKQLANALREDSQQRILVRIGNNFKLVELKETAYVTTENKMTIVTTRQGQKMTVDYSLDKMESMLNSRNFFRINRQFIVNIEAIEKMSMASKSRVRLELSPPCKEITIVSTERSPKFKKWLVGEVY